MATAGEDGAVVAQKVKDDSLDGYTKTVLGVTPGNGKRLGLSEDWFVQMVKAVGNFGEVFERSLGKQSPFKLDRGLTGLRQNGGLLYSPPLSGG